MNAENQNIEYKETWRDEYLKWICGFANAQGGKAKLHEPHASNARNKNIAFAFYKAGFIEAWGRGISKIVTQFTAAGLKEPKFEDFCGGVRVTIYRNTDLVAETIEKNDGEVTKRVTVNDEEVTKRVVEGVTVNAKVVTVNEESAQKSTQKNNGEVVDNGVGGIVKRIDKIDEGAQKSTQKTDNGVTVNQKVILDEIEKNARITAQQLAEILHISLRKTKKHIAILRDKGLIQRIGPDKGGHWEIIKQNNNN